MKNKTLTTLIATGALALGVCEKKTNSSNPYEFANPFWIPNCEMTPGYDVTFDGWGTSHSLGNVLRIGKMEDPNSHRGGFNKKYPLLLASDVDRDGVFDSIEFINDVKEGDPIELYADRQKLHEIADKLIASRK